MEKIDEIVKVWNTITIIYVRLKIHVNLTFATHCMNAMESEL